MFYINTSNLSLRNIFVYYAIIGIPFLLLILGVNFEFIDSRTFFIGLMVWIFFYHPLLTGIRRTLVNNHRILATRAETEELTYNYISREIHDNVNLTLVTSRLYMINIQKNCDAAAGAMAGVAIDLLSKSLDELSNLSRSLSIERFKSNRLYDVLAQDINILNREGSINFEIIHEGNIKSFDVEREVQVYRIVQEAVNNVLKHSEARNCRITLNFQPHALQLTIADDGKGFNPEIAAKKDWRAGLGNMQKRVSLLNGKFDLKSRPQKGASIILFIPYKERRTGLLRFLN